MEVILLDKIDKLGDLGELCEVKPGYARNYLFPQNKALPATPESKQKYEELREQLEQQLAERQQSLGVEAAKARQLKLSFKRRASEEGKLYGSISINDILHELQDKKIKVAKRQINMPTGALKQTGEFEVEIRFDADNVVTLPVEVVPLTEE